MNNQRYVMAKIKSMVSPTPDKVAVSAFDRTALDWLIKQNYVELWGPDWSTALIMPTIAGNEWYTQNQ